MLQVLLRLDQQVADPNDVRGFPLERDTKVLSPNNRGCNDGAAFGTSIRERRSQRQSRAQTRSNRG